VDERDGEPTERSSVEGSTDRQASSGEPTGSGDRSLTGAERAAGGPTGESAVQRRTAREPAVATAESPRTKGLTESLAGENWPAAVADTIEDAVATVHDRVIRPLLIVGRAAVFGIIVSTMLLVIGVVLSVALIRLLTVYVFDGRVWASDMLVGALFCAVGFFAWSRRSSEDTESA